MDYKKRYIIYLEHEKYFKSFSFRDYSFCDNQILKRIVLTDVNGQILINEPLNSQNYLLINRILHDSKNQIIIFDNDCWTQNNLCTYWNFSPSRKDLKLIDLKNEYIKQVNYKYTDDDFKNIVEADTPEDAVNEIFKLYKQVRKKISYSTK